MKLSAIPQLYRNVRRWQEIIVVLRRYGLADWLSNLKVDFIRDWIKDENGIPLASYSRESRIRMTLTDLGPTFIKFGQILSLRPDLVGSKLAAELQQLQSNVPADPPEKVLAIIEHELKQPISALFQFFDEQPIASASIGQVHAAIMHDGTRVVIKVQHADIEKTIHEDLDVLAGLATLSERIPEIAAWQPKALVEQLSRSLRRELNFTRELQNLQLFCRELKNFQGIHVPTPYPKLSTKAVLTMERVDGRSIAEVSTDPARRETLQALGKRTAELYIEMIFRLGVYHADPHPGNVLVRDDDSLALIDFGMVGRLDDRLRESVEEMLMAVATRDAALLTSLVKRVGKAPAKLDESQLSNDVADLIANYGYQPLASFDLGGALNDMTDILHSHRIVLPSQTALLIKTLITLEGVLHQLNPNFSLIEALQPFFRKIRFRRLSPVRQAKRLRRIYVELENFVERLPTQISSLLEIVGDGRLDVHLSHRGLSPSINRLVMGILTSSLFLGSSVLLAYKVPPLLFLQPGPMGMRDVSLLGLTGYVVSFLISLRLFRAINKSGHLDPGADEQDI
jgi:ubiquinone biosynthesis protein